MSALANDALTGIDVGYAAARRVGAVADGASVRGDIRALAGGLVELGARLAADDAPVDLLLVRADAASSLDEAADGTLATALTDSFSAARDGVSRLRPGGCLLFVLSPADDVTRAAVESLTRTLALEWAPDLRANALVCADPTAAVDLAALVAWQASRTLTGAVLESGPPSASWVAMRP